MLMLPLTKLALASFGFKRMLRWANCELGDSQQIEHIDVFWILELAEKVSNHGIVRVTCLPRSLLLCRLLRKRGFPAELKIGVHENLEVFLAHAWVSLPNLELENGGDDLSVFNQPLTTAPAKGTQ